MPYLYQSSARISNACVSAHNISYYCSMCLLCCFRNKKHFFLFHAWICSSVERELISPYSLSSYKCRSNLRWLSKPNFVLLSNQVELRRFFFSFLSCSPFAPSVTLTVEFSEDKVFKKMFLLSLLLFCFLKRGRELFQITGCDWTIFLVLLGKKTTEVGSSEKEK